MSTLGQEKKGRNFVTVKDLAGGYEAEGTRALRSCLT